MVLTPVLPSPLPGPGGFPAHSQPLPSSLLLLNLGSYTPDSGLGVTVPSRTTLGPPCQNGSFPKKEKAWDFPGDLVKLKTE